MLLDFSVWLQFAILSCSAVLAVKIYHGKCFPWGDFYRFLLHLKVNRQAPASYPHTHL